MEISLLRTKFLAGFCALGIFIFLGLISIKRWGGGGGLFALASGFLPSASFSTNLDRTMAAISLREPNAGRKRWVVHRTVLNPSTTIMSGPWPQEPAQIPPSQPKSHRTFCTINPTLSRTFSVPQTPDLPPRRHSSPMASSPLPASPMMTSISRFWLLTQRFTKPTGSRLISLRKACLALECASALIRSAWWSS